MKGSHYFNRIDCVSNSKGYFITSCRQLPSQAEDFSCALKSLRLPHFSQGLQILFLQFVGLVLASFPSACLGQITYLDTDFYDGGNYAASWRTTDFRSTGFSIERGSGFFFTVINYSTSRVDFSVAVPGYVIPRGDYAELNLNAQWALFDLEGRFTIYPSPPLSSFHLRYWELQEPPWRERTFSGDPVYVEPGQYLRYSSSLSNQYTFVHSSEHVDFLPERPRVFGPVIPVPPGPRRPPVIIFEDGPIINGFTLGDLTAWEGFNVKLEQKIVDGTDTDPPPLLLKWEDLNEDPPDDGPPGSGVGFRGAQLYRQATIPSGAKYMRFELFNDIPGNGDLLQVAFGNTLLYELPLFGVRNPIINSGAIYVGDLAGLTDRFLISLTGAGEQGTSVYLRNLQFYDFDDSAGLAGDFDSDFDVDGADFLTWQRDLGSTTNLAADANKNGIVDSADLPIWHDNFGIGNQSSNAVPEPTTLYQLLLCLVFASRLMRRCDGQVV